MNVCKDLILKNIDGSNAVDVFNLGNLFNLSDMKALAFSEINRMHPELKFTKEIIKKPRELMALLGFKEYKDETDDWRKGKSIVKMTEMKLK